MLDLFTQPLNYLLLVCTVFVFSCQKPPPPNTSKFSIEDTANLGKNINTAISSNPDEYKLLDPQRYPSAYQFVETALTEILSTNEVTYTTEYEWDVTIIQDDLAFNSFVLPGGSIYITTGLLKNYIETRSELFSVIAHELVYADRGFVLNLLETEYSQSTLLDIALGNNPDLAAELAVFLNTTPYSENSIFEADKKTCRIICMSDYKAASFSDFLIRLFPDTVIGWTTLHPDNGFRVTNVNSTLQQLDCTGSVIDSTPYEDFISSLP